LIITTLEITIPKVFSQIPLNKCGSMEYLQKQKDADPSLEAMILLQEKQIQQWINENYDSKSNRDKIQSVITVPIVVHILYNADYENISDQRVFEQIEMLNRDYAGLNTHSMGAFPDSLKVNTGIQFCLAQRKSDGTPTNGIERIYTSKTYFNWDTVKFANLGGLDAWDPEKYLNIWVCNLIKYIAYANFPGISERELYGVVINYNYFGSKGALPSYNNGGTLTHEIGHCFNLHHIWGDDQGECYGTDYCKDTPNQANPTYGTPYGIRFDNCTQANPGIMYMNFMDYTNDSVRANFTPNQVARIQACFAMPSGPLVSLLSSNACSHPTSVEQALVFTIEDINLYPNPASDFIEITGINPTVNHRVDEQIWIYNTLGECVMNPTPSLPASGEGVRIDVSGLPAGMYVIRFGSYTKKFLILK
jgi:hypothetical protein